MSVIHYGPHELGELAFAYAASAEPQSQRRRQLLEETAMRLARCAHENAMAYHHSYAENHAEVSDWNDLIDGTCPEGILNVAFTLEGYDPDRVRRNMMLLRYNLIANDGTDFATQGTLDLLVEMLGELWRLERLAAEMGQ